MRTLILFISLSLSVMSISQSSIYDFSFTSIQGDTIHFSDFKGKKILIVNTASECGFTPQYKELQKVHETYKDKLVVIGFPANNFGGQEPGNNEEIKSFCEKNYGVTFTLASKVSVKGEDINEIFAWLIKQNNPNFTGDIKWNFEKFLIDENGHLMARFRSQTKPDSDKIIKLL